LTPAGQVDLTGRDDGRDAAVEAGLDEVERLLARGEVAEHRVGVRVDQTGDRRRAPGIDQLVDVARRCGVAVQRATDRRDATVLDQDRIGVGERRLAVAGGDRSDVDDQGAHGRR